MLVLPRPNARHSIARHRRENACFVYRAISSLNRTAGVRLTALTRRYCPDGDAVGSELDGALDGSAAWEVAGGLLVGAGSVVGGGVVGAVVGVGSGLGGPVVWVGFGVGFVGFGLGVVGCGLGFGGGGAGAGGAGGGAGVAAGTASKTRVASKKRDHQTVEILT